MEDTQGPSKARPREPTPAPKPESTKHLRVLSNGAVYDMNKGRIVDSKNVTTKITSEKAVEYSRQRQELKRAAMVKAANRVAEQGGAVDGSEFQGDMAYVEAIGEAMTMKALSVNDPKAVEAARFVYTETGIAEAQQQPGPQNNTINMFVMPDHVIDFLSDLKQRLGTETGISESNKGRIVDASAQSDTPTLPAVQTPPATPDRASPTGEDDAE